MMYNIVKSDYLAYIDKLKGEGVLIDCIITDPPYLMKYSDFKKGDDKKELRRITNNLRNITTDNNLIKGFDITAFFNAAADLFIDKKELYFIFCNNALLYELVSFFKDKNKYSTNILIWQKETPLPLVSGCFLSDKEYIFFIKRRGVRLNHLRYDIAKTILYERRGVNYKETPHPTEKPTPLLYNLLQKAAPSVAVLDCFLGSGSTGVAVADYSKSLRFYGCDINQSYLDIAKQRLVNAYNSLF